MSGQVITKKERLEQIEEQMIFTRLSYQRLGMVCHASQQALMLSMLYHDFSAVLAAPESP